MNAAIGATMTNIDRRDTIDPVVLIGRGLKQEVDSEMKVRRIDYLAFLNPFGETGQIAAHAAVCHHT
jgi:hypothetical protein